MQRTNLAPHATWIESIAQMQRKASPRAPSPTSSQPAGLDPHDLPIYTLDDAITIVKLAGLDKPWFPIGSASTFSTWLHNNRHQANPMLLDRELAEYLDELHMHARAGGDLDADLIESAKATRNIEARMAVYHDEIAYLIEKYRSRAEGHLALQAFVALATSQGKHIGESTQSVSSLLLLSQLVQTLEDLLESYPRAARMDARKIYTSSESQVDSSAFLEIEQALAERRSAPFMPTHPAIQLTIGLVDDPTGRGLLAASLMKARTAELVRDTSEVERTNSPPARHRMGV
jgi:hypothetical protein